jgi:hypothetical protein
MKTSSQGRHYREGNMPAFMAISDYQICKPGTMHALANSYETGVPKKTRLRKLLTQEEKNTLI